MTTSADDRPDFAAVRLSAVVRWIESASDRGTRAVSFVVTDPDPHPRAYPGEQVRFGDETLVHRPLRAWVDLAERLRMRLCLPRPLPGTGRMVVTFEPLDEAARPWSSREEPIERYGADSQFQRMSRLDDPYFVLDVRDALDRVGLRPGARILDIGVNTGDEIDLLRKLGVPEDTRWVGLDHSPSAIARARERFPGQGFEFFVADVNHLAGLELGRFDLVISIGTLQSPRIDDREVFRGLFQHHLAPGGSIMLGFPNCQYVDGQVLYGARTLNVRQPELSLLVKTVAYYKKYLQQHHLRVFVTGKDDVLITGVGRPR